MGKASRWFRGLFSFKASGGAHKSKKKWSSAKSRKEEDGVVQGGRIGDGDDASKRAIAVAAATAAVAEAAVAAAQAAAAVVRLTSSGRNISVSLETAAAAVGIVVRSRSGHWSREEQAAVTIQSHFRAYLSRRALRALKALVRLQALVRGHLVRKQTAYVLRRLQALVRAQTRARAGRVLASEPVHSGMKPSHFSYPGPATPEKVEHQTRARSMEQGRATLERSGSKSSRSVNYDPEKDYICVDSRPGERYREQRTLPITLPTEDDHSAKILEIDTGANPRFDSKLRSCFCSSHLNPGADQSVLTASCGEAQSLGPLKFVHDASTYCTAENSPTFYSTSSMEGNSKRGLFTPTNSDCSRSCLSSYYDHHPNYMSYTESSKAKVRSASAPKLRPQFDRSSSAKRYTVHRYSDSGSSQKGSLSHAIFTNKAYPGSGHLDRLGMHVQRDISGFSGGHWQRC